MSLSSIAGSAAGVISTLAPLVPQDVRARFEEKVRKYNPFQRIRSNHVLTRGVRLSWAEAMRHIQKEIGALITEDRLKSEREDLERFKILVDQIVDEVSDNAANRDPGVKLLQYECLDSYTRLVLERLPKHLRFDEVVPPDEASKQRFTEAVQGITGWNLSEIPAVYKQFGGQVFQIADGGSRDFERLLLDAFNVRVANPKDQALAFSFRTVQEDITKDYLEVMLEDLRNLQPVKAEEIILAFSGPIRELGDRIDRQFRRYVERHELSHHNCVATNVGCFIEPSHRFNREGDALRGLESLHFRNRQDDLLGRKQLLDDLMKRFLGDALRGAETEPFLWTLIYGDAGTGKSRLALELLVSAEEAYKSAHNGAEPELFGFLDRDGCCDAEGFRLDLIDHWSPDATALLVIDYAGSLTKLPETIAKLTACAERCKQPIRLVLLDRKATGTLEGLALHTDASKPHVTTRFEAAVKAYATHAGIRLRGLNREHALHIVRNRLGARSAGFSDADLIRRLDSICPDNETGEANPDTYRPLFAAMIGEFLAASAAKLFTIGASCEEGFLGAFLRRL